MRIPLRLAALVVLAPGRLGGASGPPATHPTARMVSVPDVMVDTLEQAQRRLGAIAYSVGSIPSFPPTSVTRWLRVRRAPPTRS